MPALVRALKSVDLPTLGRPTMPHFKLMERLSSGNRKAGDFTGPTSIEAPVRTDALPHAQRAAVALQHDGVHAEGDGAAHARVRVVAAQGVAHHVALLRGIGID